MIRLDIPTVCLLHRLPNEFTIGQVDERNEITITVEGKDIYSTTLYGNNGECTFYDLRSLVHDNMRQRGLVMARLVIYLAMEGGGEVFDGHYIVFSDINVPYDDNDEFLEKHFLTTRTYYTLPRNEISIAVALVLMAGQTESVYYDCAFRRADGSAYSARFNYSTVSASSQPQVKSFYVSLSTLESYARNNLGADYGTLVAFSLSVGKRNLSFYVTDEHPVEKFYFRNVFNTNEVACIYGTKVTKTSFSSKEARCGGLNMQYDLTRDQKFQIETRALPIEEAEWLTQMFETDQVTVHPNYLSAEKVVFSDISSEISNSPKDQVHLKFSYQYQTNMLYMKEQPTFGNQFSSPFTPPFT